MRITKPVIILTAIFELVTLFFRFGLGLESTKHTASTVGKLTFGIRIHHGYIGLLLFIIAIIINRRSARLAPAKQISAESNQSYMKILKSYSIPDLLKIIGLALFFSDIIHHLLLYLITGSADLDLVYPAG